MANKIIGTGTISGNVELKDGKLSFYAISVKTSIDKATNKPKRERMLLFVTYPGRDAERYASLTNGARIAYKGRLTGDAKGNPKIYLDASDDDKAEEFTRFDVQAVSLRYLGKGDEKDTAADDLLFVELIGHTGRDGELKIAPDGEPVYEIGLATTSTFGTGDAKTYETTWFQLAIWGDKARRMAEMNKNQGIPKGTKLIVEAGLHFDPKNGGPVMFKRRSGETGSKFEGTIYTWEFAASKGEGNGTHLPPAEVPDESEEVPTV